MARGRPGLADPNAAAAGLVMAARTAPCDPHIADGRRLKASQFAEAFDTIYEFADEPGDVADACVTLAVHSGIASADVITCTRLQQHAQGDDHAQAVALLQKAAGTSISRHLDTLLGMKSRAGYSHDPATAAQLKKAKRAMDALLDTVRGL